MPCSRTILSHCPTDPVLYRVLGSTAKDNNLAPLSFVDVSETDYTDGMLANYELNDPGILREVFIQAYERSAQRYAVIRGVIGDSDPFRVKYRQSLTELVGKSSAAAAPVEKPSPAYAVGRKTR